MVREQALLGLDPILGCEGREASGRAEHEGYQPGGAGKAHGRVLGSVLRENRGQSTSAVPLLPLEWAGGSVESTHTADTLGVWAVTKAACTRL